MELFQDARFAPPTERIVSAAEVFALNDAMRRYVREQLDVRRATRGSRQALVDAVLYGDLKLEYDSAHTGTAAETFEARAGNIESLPLSTDEVDVVLANMVLHHAPDPSRASGDDDAH